MNENNDQHFNEVQAVKCEILGSSAATQAGEKCVLLTVRMNPNSYKVTELLFSLSQAKERLQIDVADLLERSPLFQELETTDESEDV